MDQSGSLQKLTYEFSLDVLRFSERIRIGRMEDVLCRQLIRSATSVGANYRASCRARSKAEFIAKMGIVEEEADESIYWMNLMVDVGICKAEEVELLINRANEIVAMTVASIRTARKNKRLEKTG